MRVKRVGYVLVGLVIVAVVLMWSWGRFQSANAGRPVLYKPVGPTPSASVR